MITYQLHHSGMLQSIKNRSFNWEFPSDDLIIETNYGEYHLSQIACQQEGDTYVYTTEEAVFSVSYALVSESSFLVRKLSVLSRKNGMQILSIGVTVPKCKTAFMYETFYNASAAVFCREENHGLCLGFENPFCELKNDLVYFEPSWILQSEETFVCDLNFYGIYILSGELVRPHLDRSLMYTGGRFHPRYRNPGEGTPLYFSEIKAFNEYTANYFDCKNKTFKFTSYNFFSNLPQRPETEEQVETYLAHIDTFAAIGGDAIILNPLCPNKIPNEDPHSYWELFPDNSIAERIYTHARNKGLEIGVYTGTAGNIEFSNSSMTSYADVPQWKKININSERSTENCLAEDSFVDWFIQVQINTIEKYQLTIWDWDPGPGNGFFCYSENHGHLPGKGGYKGFRNSLKVMKALKDRFPKLYFQGFHGNKEFGLWGFKYIDQHEAYWENDVYGVTPIFEDLSVERCTGHGIRFQSIWNYFFRFMPATLNHGLAHRMIQSCGMGELHFDKAFEHIGWKHSLMSSIAAGGSVTLPIIPENPAAIPDYIPFYKKWIAFARDIFSYSQHTIPFGDQTGCGIDGFAKIYQNEGYIFLFNSFGTPLKTTFTFDERLGFSTDCPALTMSMIYPHQKAMDSVTYGLKHSFIIPAYGCIVLSLSRCTTTLPDDELSPALPRTLFPQKAGEFTFFAHKEMADRLYKGDLTEAIAVQQLFAEHFKHINDCWNRPDRLWLWINPIELTEQAKVFVNNKEVPYKQEILFFYDMRQTSLLFADITDFVEWGKENLIELANFSADYVYLYYPALETEDLPSVYTPHLQKGCPAPLQDESVEILSACVNEDNIVHRNAPNTIYATVNIPAEELEGVYASVPIPVEYLAFDLSLKYNDGIWRNAFFIVNHTSLIIDDDKIVVWAVTKDQKESKSYKIPINWDL